MKYQIKCTWNQDYTTWTGYAERVLELKVELSEYKEANEVINRIKAML